MFSYTHLWEGEGWRVNTINLCKSYSTTFDKFVEAIEVLGSWKPLEVLSLFSLSLSAHSSSAWLFLSCLLYNTSANVSSVSLRSGTGPTTIYSWTHIPLGTRSRVKQITGWIWSTGELLAGSEVLCETLRNKGRVSLHHCSGSFFYFLFPFKNYLFIYFKIYPTVVYSILWKCVLLGSYWEPKILRHKVPYPLHAALQPSSNSSWRRT